MQAKSSRVSIMQQLHSKLEFYKRLIEALGSDEDIEVHCLDKTWLREAKQSRDGVYGVFLSFRFVDCRCQRLTRNPYYCHIFWGPSQFQLLDRTEYDHSSFEQLFQLTSLDYKHYLPRQRISTWRRAQDLSGDLGECTLYTFPLQCTESTLLKKDIPTSTNQGKRFSLDNNESRVTISIDDTLNQHKRKQTVSVSSFVIVAYISLSSLVICNQSPLGKHLITTPTQVHQLHKEHGPISIGVLLLDLLGFMVFVWAVVIKILVGAPFNNMQSAVLLFWAILMHIKSAYSINVVSVQLLGIFLVGRYALGKQLPNNGR